jgi:hypothetical protein
VESVVPLDPVLDPEEPVDPALEPEESDVPDEPDEPEDDEPLLPDVAVVDDESHLGADSSSVFFISDDASLACFGVPPQAASASPMAIKPIIFEVRMPMGLARFYGGQHST